MHIRLNDVDLLIGSDNTNKTGYFRRRFKIQTLKEGSIHHFEGFWSLMPIGTNVNLISGPPQSPIE